MTAEEFVEKFPNAILQYNSAEHFGTVRRIYPGEDDMWCRQCGGRVLAMLTMKQPTFSCRECGSKGSMDSFKVPGVDNLVLALMKLNQ